MSNVLRNGNHALRMKVYVKGYYTYTSFCLGRITKPPYFYVSVGFIFMFLTWIYRHNVLDKSHRLHVAKQNFLNEMNTRLRNWQKPLLIFFSQRVFFFFFQYSVNTTGFSGDVITSQFCKSSYSWPPCWFPFSMARHRKTQQNVLLGFFFSFFYIN